MRILAFNYSDRLLTILGAAPARQHLSKHIADPALRQKLTPDYTIGCKRILVSNDFYPTLCLPHVHLHDKTQGIQRFTEQGVVTADGQEIALDAVIYATGFDATDQVISYPVEGIQGKRLATFWADFPRAYLGTSMPDFPNLFIVTGPNTGIGHTSAIFMIEAQMDYIMRALEYVKQRQANHITVRPQAEQDYTYMIHQQMAKTVWQTGGCNSWYKSKTGKVVAMFPGFSFMFKHLCRRFKANHHIIE